MLSFWSSLWARPEVLSPVCRYTVANGILYMVTGTAIYLAPHALLEVAFFTELEPASAGFANLLGMAVLFIGWFYVMGGRTGADSFALGTVVDRLLLPLILIPIVASGTVPWVPLAVFAVLDPALALGALLIWRRTQAAVSA